MKKGKKMKEVEVAKPKYSTIEHTNKYLQSIGLSYFQMPSKPIQGNTDLPDDLTAVESEDLGRHLQALTQMFVYAKGKMVEAEIRKEVTERLFDKKFDEILLRPEVQSKWSTVNEKKAEARNDAEVSRNEAQYLSALSDLLAIKSITEGYEKLANMVSREITRRVKLIGDGGEM